MQGGNEVVCGPTMTVKEVAARLKTSTATVYGLCESGRLSPLRVSTNAIRVLASDLVGHIRSRRIRR
jgi:excisionase family DNA binding protein